MTDADDRAAIERVLAGDVAAFETVVRRWQRPLINLAYRFCRDPGRAEELAQEAFLQVYRTLGRYSREASFSTWLFAVALNLYRSHMRRIGPPLSSVDAVPDIGVADRAGPELDARERDEGVRAEVARLPPRYRDAIVVYYFQEHDLEGTARILGVPAGTAKAHLYRGRELLRRRLTKLAGAAVAEETA